MATSTEKLLKWKQEIEQAKLDKASVEGRLKQNLQRLKDEFHVRSCDSAKAKLSELVKKKEQLETALEAIVKRLDENYSW